MFSLHHSMPTDSPVVGYTARDTVWNLVRRAALGSWSHYCWTRALLDALGYPRQQMGFSHTSHTATHVLQHRCDQWASADAGIVRQDSPRASRPQAILKLHPPSSLDNSTRYGFQTSLISKFLFVCFSLDTLHRVLGTDMTLKISNINKIYIFETLGAWGFKWCM